MDQASALLCALVEQLVVDGTLSRHGVSQTLGRARVYLGDPQAYGTLNHLVGEADDGRGITGVVD